MTDSQQYNIALRHDNVDYSYQQLSFAISKVNELLQTHKVNEGDGVAIYLDRSPECIAIIMSCLVNNIYFVPLETSWPKKRVESVLSNSQVKLIFHNENYFSETSSVKITSEIFNGNQNYSYQLKNILKEEGKIAYLLYTSGSTGEPKGVAISKKALANYLFNAEEIYSDGDKANFPLFTSLGFDLTLTSILLPLYTGGSITIYNNSNLADVLTSILKNEEITHLKLTPSHLQFIDQNVRSSSIGVIILGGENLSYQQVNKVRSCFDVVKFYNEYGPTEATIGCGVHLVQQISRTGSVPLGIPFKNVQFTIDPNNNELLIAGHSLFNGYWKNNQATKKTLVNIEGEIWYRSGDQVFEKDGEIYYQGRLNKEVKVNGFRVNLAGIENELRHLTNISDAVVIPIEGKLVAFIQTEFKVIDDIEVKLYEIFPEYSVPSKYFYLSQFPLTINGKIDTNKLIDSVIVNYEIEEITVEEWLVRFVSELLKINKLKVEDNFFSVGGDSLSAVYLVNEINTVFATDITVLELYRTHNIKDLISLIEDHKGNNKEQIIDSVEKEEHTSSLSSFQKELVAWSKMFPDSTAYNETVILEIDNKYRKEEVIKAIEYLRIKFDSFNVQLHDVSEFSLKMVPLGEYDLETKSFESLEDGCNSLVRPFGMKEYLWRAYWVVTQEGNSLLMDIHHLITDYHSQQLILNYFFDFLLNKNRNHPEVGLYNSNSILQTFDLSDYLKGISGKIPFVLPVDESRNVETSSRSVVINSETVAAIDSFSKKNNLTAFSCYLSAFIFNLRQFIIDKDVCVGIAVSLRGNKISHLTSGPALNTLPFVSRNNNALNDIKANIKNTSEDFWKLFAARNMSGTEIVSQSDLEVSEDGFVYDGLFVFQSEHNAEIPVGFDLIKPKHREAKTKLLVEIDYSQKEVVLRMDYMEKYLNEKLVAQLMDSFQTVLTAIPMVQNYSDITLKESDSKILDKYIVEENLVDRFKKSATQYSDAIAIIYKENSYTYAQIDKWSDNLASYLRNEVNDSSFVPVILDRSLEMILTVQALWKVGKAYVPIDPIDPLHKRNALLTQIGNSQFISTVENKSDESIVIAPEIWEDENCVFKKVQLEPKDPAYMIFTSGSTGIPKGVVVPHSAIYNRIEWADSHFNLKVGEVLMHKTPLTFDVSVWELTAWFFSGATLAILPVSHEKNPEQIIDCIQTNHVTHLHFVPSMLRLFLSYSLPSRIFDSIKQIYCSGEALLPSDVVVFYQLFGDNVLLTNLYGPTEAAVDVTYYDLENKTYSEIPIGKSIYNVAVEVVNEKGVNLPPFACGDIVIKGIGLASGYFEDVQKTMERFIEGTNRYYKTGDIGYIDDNEVVYYLGRKDQEIKVGGVRINLDGLRKRIIDSLHVKECVVFVHPLLKSLCAAFVNSDIDKLGLSISQIERKLKEELSVRELPNKFYTLEHIPLTSSGKTDINTLCDQSSFDESEEKDKISLGLLHQKMLAMIRQSLLMNDLLISDNYFHSGGTSLSLIELVTRFDTELGVKISIGEVYKKPLIGQILNQSGNKQQDLLVVLGDESKPKIFCFPPAAGFGLVYQKMQELLADYCLIAYNFQPVDNYLDILIDSILDIQPDNKVILLGYSGGGNIAFNLAKRLNNKVSKLILLDAYARNSKLRHLGDHLIQLKELLILKTQQQLTAINSDLIRTRIDDYYDYFWTKDRDDGQLNVPIVLIKSPENNLLEIIHDQETRKVLENSWAQHSNINYTEIIGEGSHQEFLDTPFVEQNVCLIKSELEG